MSEAANFYLDAITSVGTRYGSCKKRCITTSPGLEAAIKDDSLRSSKFDPMMSDPCLKECR